MRELIRGRVVIHRDEDMMFPDREPIIIEGEGLTHHVICERNQLEVILHKVTFIRREMYGMLGDMYNLTDQQRKEVNLVAVSYRDYFMKLDIMEGRQEQRKKQVEIQMEDENSEWLWEELKKQDDKEKQEKLEAELRLQSQIQTSVQQIVQQEVEQIPQSEPKLSSRQHIRPTQEHVIGQDTRSAENLNDISVQEQELDSSLKTYILTENVDRDDDQEVKTIKAVIPGNKRRVTHLQYYLKRGDDFRKQGRTRNAVLIQIQQFNTEKNFIQFKYKTSQGPIEVYNLFVWKYADRYVDFSYYMMSMQRTTEWWYIVDHYSAVWVARSRGIWSQMGMTEEMKQFQNLNLNHLQQLYDSYIERQIDIMYKASGNTGQIWLITQYEWEKQIFSMKKIDGEELLIENDAFFEYSNFTIVYTRNKETKARQIKSLSYKIKHMKDHIGKVFSKTRDVHAVIQTFIKFNILVPGLTPLTAYKWGSFNVNIFTNSLSASMESMLSSNASAYERVTPQEQIKNWVELYINLTKEEQKQQKQ